MKQEFDVVSDKYIVQCKPANFQICKQFREQALLRIRPSNGAIFLTATLFEDHYSHASAEMIEFFRLVGELAPGSYGLLYMRDDEDEEGKDNVFQVYVLARGVLTPRIDTYLSPVIPVIMD